MKNVKCSRINETIDSLRECNLPHEISKTSLTTVLKFKDLTFKQTQGGMIKNKELFFIKKWKLEKLLKHL